MSHWVSTWGQSHTAIQFMSPNYQNRTMHLTVHNNLDGEQVRLRISNLEGKKPLHVLQGSLQVGFRERIPLLFQGQKSLTVEPSDENYSDAVSVHVKAGDKLTISMAFQGPVRSGNNIMECIHCSKNGNFVDAPQFNTVHRNKTSCYHDMPQAIPAVSSIEVFASDDAGAIICFGDSITQKSEWTHPLLSKVCAFHPGTVSVINKGINGNRLLRGPFASVMSMYGRAGIQRFQRDVLEEAGAKVVIIAIGTNDFGMARNTKGADWVTADQLSNSIRQLAEKARAQGMIVYGTTLLPRVGTTGYLQSQEKERTRFNQWVLETDVFSGVFDFNRAVCDPKHPEIMEFSCDSGDHLHPGPIGGERMAQCAWNTLQGNV